MSENKTNGQIQIADEVVGVIATTAALEVEGVVAGGGKGFVELFGKKGHTKCAKITKDDPLQLRRVYETGRAVAEIQVDKIAAFVNESKAAAEE